MSSATPTDLILRPASVDDADAIAGVHLASRAAAARAGVMPPSTHEDREAQPWLAQRLLHDEAWVAEVEGAVVAYVRLTDEWLDDLYVAPGLVGHGVGSALLEVAKAVRPGGFGLWVFEVNEPARRFYAAHGLVEVERTDGRDNEERCPDVLMRWERVDVGAT